MHSYLPGPTSYVDNVALDILRPSCASVRPVVPTPPYPTDAEVDGRRAAGVGCLSLKPSSRVGGTRC